MAFAQLKLLDKENVSLRVKEEHRQKSFTTSSNNTNDSHSERTNDIQSPATICQDANQSTAEKILRFCSGSSVICFDKILVSFNAESGLNRRPVAHTCCLVESLFLIKIRNTVLIPEGKFKNSLMLVCERQKERM